MRFNASVAGVRLASGERGGLQQQQQQVRNHLSTTNHWAGAEQSSVSREEHHTLHPSAQHALPGLLAVPVTVLTASHSHQRQNRMRQRLQAAGVQFSFFKGLAGSRRIPDAKVCS